MEKLDQDLQKRVWQRVQGKSAMPPLGKLSCKSWMLTLQENAADYQTLAQSLSGREAEQLRRLYRQCQSCIACMKGLCHLRGEKVNIAPLPRTGQGGSGQLERCYRRERQLWEELERQSADPEHGAVLSHLARQAQDRSVTVLELLGNR